MLFLYINKIFILLFLFTTNLIFSNSYTGYALSVIDSSCDSNSQTSIYIDLNNEDPIAGFQFVLYDVPNILSYIDINTTARTDDFLVAAVEGEAGVTIIGFSLLGSTIDIGSGPIVEIIFDVNLVEFETIVNLGINGSVLSDQDSNSIDHITNNGFITVINENLIIPDIPNNINVVGHQNSILLNWDLVWQAEEYQIWQIIDNQQILYNQVTNNSYTIDNLDNSSEYCYSISALNSIGQSDLSTPICATTLPEEPGNAIIYFEDTEAALGYPFQIPLYLNNYYNNISGIQIRITDSPNLLTLKNIYSTDRLNGFELHFNEQIDGSILILIFSLSGETIMPGLDPILLFEYVNESISEETIFLNLSESIFSDNNSNHIEHSALNSLVLLKEEGDLDETPVTLSLSQNYPNPFNTSTVINFNILPMNDIELSIYDINGRLIKKLLDKYITSYNSQGINVIWDGRNENGIHVPSGTYIYSLNTSVGKLNNIMLLIK